VFFFKSYIKSVFPCLTWLKRVESLALNERILVEFYDRTENPEESDIIT